MGFSVGPVTRKAEPQLEVDLSFSWEGRGARDRVTAPCSLHEHHSSPGVTELPGGQQGRGWPRRVACPGRAGKRRATPVPCSRCLFHLAVPEWFPL